MSAEMEPLINNLQNSAGLRLRKNIDQICAYLSQQQSSSHQFRMLDKRLYSIFV